jgi:hypothetical protein
LSRTALNQRAFLSTGVQVGQQDVRASDDNRLKDPTKKPEFLSAAQKIAIYDRIH